ncbi:butyryl-CoA:acetate CoA-transferase [Oscillibacter sp. MSJ-2]|uniref:Butyryl-CoA:acetate CoA-transferase n=1 Tax=Dysosmobacter acutus TaxID=2841504 RepID=A0ABS6FAH1_9FIRM|nr:butyryl-CoA:acetate CoA-transferase [Dysosmobacter acutus]MBU5627285.1 butyryl-CoA:acetate CoA-transferase [Dysosmobacter acutus]
MSYAEEYAKKLTTADQAVRVVKSGDWVDYGWCTGHPRVLDQALAKRAGELTDVKVRGGICLWKPAIAEVPDAAEHFTWNSWHMSGIERKMIAEGIAFYAPIRYSELPRYYREHIVHDDVAMFQVAPMDEHGYFNFGPNASHMKAVCETSKVVIVEVNQNMPRCCGGMEECVHISDVDMIVEGNNDPMGILSGGGVPTEVDAAVAKLIVEEIPNGACLQLGIGGMPNTVGSMIAESDLKDLGVHTEMYVDAFVDIAKAGKINGSRKNIDRGRQTYGFGAGTQKLYDYLHENPELMSAPVSYTNDIRSISELDNFISINNAVDVDLFGQINAESAGVKHISGAGGQLDFVLGAYLSKGGKSFICCSSTFTDKKTGKLVSRIRPTLSIGSIVTDTRTNVHYLVTEYGKVCLKGLSTWERAEAIISIAHPDFRDELIAQAEAMRIWRASNKR